jgi:hypothetical protein
MNQFPLFSREWRESLEISITNCGGAENSFPNILQLTEEFMKENPMEVLSMFSTH